MSRLVTIDPDTKKPGLAQFDDGVLVRAVALPVDEACSWVTLLYADEIVCEMPQQYGREGDQRDFLAVARVVGRFEEIARLRGAKFIAVAPHKWKGQTPKRICTLRAWEALDVHERWGILPGGGVRVPATARARLERGQGLASGEGSDVLDAIGIGLWKLGRINRRS